VNLAFAPDGWADYTHWQTVDRAVLKRLNRLIDASLRDPEHGIGKPEPLKWELQGAWSRRITDEHRLVYLVQDGQLTILSARFHYAG
jgi:toxin YoeB